MTEPQETISLGPMLPPGRYKIVATLLRQFPTVITLDDPCIVLHCQEVRGRGPEPVSRVAVPADRVSVSGPIGLMLVTATPLREGDDRSS